MIGLLLALTAGAHTLDAGLVDLGATPDGWRVTASDEVRAAIAWPEACIADAAGLRCPRDVDWTLSIGALPPTVPAVAFRILDGGPPRLVVGGPGDRVALGERSTPLWGAARLGLEHLRAGLDHLLLVAGLTALVRRPGALLLTLTAFTAAHAITLGAAATGWVRVAVAPVEVLIAASLVLLGRELVTGRGEGSLGRPWTLAFALGLFHGLGFAASVADEAPGAGGLARFLVGFHLGIEVGQVGWTALLLVARGLLWRYIGEEAGRRLVGWGIGIMGARMVCERLL